MAVPKRKTSKMKKRIRKSANPYVPAQATFCQVCQAPVKPHRACAACGSYKGKQVLSVSAD